MQPILRAARNVQVGMSNVSSRRKPTGGCHQSSIILKPDNYLERSLTTRRQVQDLERQLDQARQQLNHLGAILKENGAADLDNDYFGASGAEPLEAGVKPQRRQRPRGIADLQSVRSDLRFQGRGLVEPPPSFQGPESRPLALPRLPGLPPKHIADQLLRQYYSSVHSIMPVLHWPSFSREYETVYRNGTLHGVPPVWGAVLFNVFACGVLHTAGSSESRLDQGKTYLEACGLLTDLWTAEFTLDHARSALLTSIFLTEMNMKSAAWVWVGSALRISQNIGLHHETGSWPVVHGEMRKRVWWAIYIWDR